MPQWSKEIEAACLGDDHFHNLEVTAIALPVNYRDDNNNNDVALTVCGLFLSTTLAANA